MSNAAIENGLSALAFARRATFGLVDEIKPSDLCHRPIPTANHPVWILGHIAWTDDFFLTQLMPRATRLPNGWSELFGMGSTPKVEVGAYPPVGVIQEHLSVLREELLAWFRGLTPEKLAAALPAELRGFSANYGTLASTLAWHEGLHAGQLTVVRKSLGLKPKFG